MRAAAQSVTTSETSASDSANTTASGGSPPSQVRVLACCSRRAWLAEKRSPKRAARAESTAFLPSLSGRCTALARPAVMACIYRSICSEMREFFGGSNACDAKHRGVVAARGRQHKSVPDGVLIGQPLPEVKHYADGVERTAESKENRDPGRHRRHQRVPGCDNRPALYEIEAHGEALEVAREEELDRDAGDGPHHGE